MFFSKIRCKGKAKILSLQIISALFSKKRKNMLSLPLKIAYFGKKYYLCSLIVYLDRA